MKYATTIEGKTFIIEINDEHGVTIDGKAIDVDVDAIGGQGIISLLLGGQSYEAVVEPQQVGWTVLLGGHFYEVDVLDERSQRLAKATGAGSQQNGETTIKAPMPGLVVSVLVAEGQSVRHGEVLVILESMKMQNEFKAPFDGTVKRVRVKAGQTVEQNAPMITIVPAESED